MSNNLRIVIVLSGLLGLAVPRPISAQVTVEALTTANLNLRAGRSTDTSIRTQIPSDSRVDLTECRDGWCAAAFQNHSGFVAARYLRIFMIAPVSRADSISEPAGARDSISVSISQDS